MNGILEAKLIRACADCEKDHGLLNRADLNKTHSQCRRHFVATLIAGGIAREIVEQEIAGMKAEDFCRDLGEVKGQP